MNRLGEEFAGAKAAAGGTPITAEDAERTDLRRRIELQHRTIEALRRALHAGGRANVVALGPRLPDQAKPPTQPVAVRSPATAWWPAVPLPAEPLSPSPGWSSYSLAGRRARVMAIAVFGLRGEDLARAVAQIADQQAGTPNFVPLFLTDAGETRVFRERGYAFEYFPPALYGGEGGPAGTERARQRLRLIERKWGVFSQIDLSAQAIPRAAPPGGAPPV